MSLNNESVRYSNRTSFSAECRTDTKLIVKSTQNPIDIELHIERARVLKILTDAISHIKLSLSLSILIEHEELLKSYLNDEQFERVSFACKKYTSTESSLSFGDHFRTPAIVPKKRRNAEPELKYDANLSEVLGLLIKKLLSLLKSQYIHGTMIDKPAELFMKKFQELIELFKEKLFVNAAAEKEREISLRKVWSDNEKIKVEIKETSAILNDKKEMYSKDYLMRKTILEKQQAQILAFRNNCKETIHKKITESEKKMAIEWQDTEIKRVELESGVKAGIQEFSQLLVNNLKTEKSLRAKCFKVETQLLSWLQKYDNDVTELNNQYEECLHEYESDFARLTDLQKLYNEHHETYVVVMAEKAAYDKKVFDDKCLFMRQTNATKKIQKWWRAYLKRKAKYLPKKKKGKGKKK